MRRIRHGRCCVPTTIEIDADFPTRGAQGEASYAAECQRIMKADAASLANRLVAGLPSGTLKRLHKLLGRALGK